MTITPPESGGGGGFCRACGTLHLLLPGNARKEAHLLQDRLAKRRSIALPPADRTADRELSTELLFGPPRGKMFGVLECLRADGERLFLYGFSGQYNGRWIVPGWAPPLFDVSALILYLSFNHPDDGRIVEFYSKVPF